MPPDTPGKPARRLTAIALLLLGLGAATWSWQQRTREVEVAWLLTHVAVRLPTAGAGSAPLYLDRSRLVGLTWRVAVPGEPERTRERHDLSFALAEAPEVTTASGFGLPAGQAVVEVGCVFALAGASEPLRTRMVVLVDPEREGVQVVDVGTCGDLEVARRPPRP